MTYADQFVWFIPNNILVDSSHIFIATNHSGLLYSGQQESVPTIEYISRVRIRWLIPGFVGFIGELGEEHKVYAPQPN